MIILEPVKYILTPILPESYHKSQKKLSYLSQVCHKDRAKLKNIILFMRKHEIKIKVYE